MDRMVICDGGMKGTPNQHQKRCQLIGTLEIQLIGAKHADKAPKGLYLAFSEVVNVLLYHGVVGGEG
jgi:hypothetical protein